MNWAKYSERKGKSADFKSKERDVNGEKESYIVLVQKRWNSESGKPLADIEVQYSLSELEFQKSRYDDDIAKAKEQSDGLKKAIADFKKVK
jgi:hypothetical protein